MFARRSRNDAGRVRRSVTAVAGVLVLFAMGLVVASSASAAPSVYEDAKLTPSDAAPDDLLGESVAVSGDTAVVGAPRDDDAGDQSGSAHVFTYSGGVWSEQAKLTASDAAAWDFFGTSVAVSGDTAVVGAYFGDAVGETSGAAYVFTPSGGVWTEQAVLAASDAARGDVFGASVAVSDDTAVVGAPQDDDTGRDSGSAYVFELAVDPAPGDSGLIAFSTRAGSSSGDSTIWTMEADGSRLQELTRGSTPAWSPDGTQLAFSDAGGIWVIGADGSNRTQLSAGSDWSPTWSPDGSKIAYAHFSEHDDGAQDYDIWVMNADGSDPRSLGGWSGSWETFPTWSPDGSMIAFASHRFYDGPDDRYGDIFVMDATGSDVIRVTSHTAGDGFPDWSPDGTKILFTRRSDPHMAAEELYTISPDTGAELLIEFVNVGQASWSPDGEHIVLNGGYSSDIYRTRGDGSGTPVQFTSLNFSDEKYSDWQPISTGLDTDPPTCEIDFIGTTSEGQGQFTYTVQDMGSGLGSIEVTKTYNVVLEPPPDGDGFITDFEVGTTEPVIVTETQDDPWLPAISALAVTDRAGNATECDPVYTAVVREKGAPADEVFDGIPAAEHLVTSLQRESGPEELGRRRQRPHVQGRRAR